MFFNEVENISLISLARGATALKPAMMRGSILDRDPLTRKSLRISKAWSKTCVFFNASLTDASRSTARTLTSVVVNWQINADLCLKSMALCDSKAAFCFSRASKLEVKTFTVSEHADIRCPFLAPAARAIAACRRILKFRASLIRSNNILTMKSIQWLPTFIAESFCSKDPTPWHAFHCVFALPVVRQLAKLCAASCSQSFDVSKTVALIRCPIPLVAFARTLSPCSIALMINTLASAVTVSSFKRCGREALTEQRFAIDQMAGIFTDLELSCAAMSSDEATCSSSAFGKLMMKPSALHAAARTAGTASSPDFSTACGIFNSESSTPSSDLKQSTTFAFTRVSAVRPATRVRADLCAAHAGNCTLTASSQVAHRSSIDNEDGLKGTLSTSLSSSSRTTPLPLTAPRKSVNSRAEA
ncbi:hypothetical protein BE221DRAFT_69303 [Ostreococcus tauri]|uniref:Uncharacterized protein n=1 Tax=Ostreococcus tauri TaxID=70448 RepID=A0A1Y5IKC1_OSTTA|nr:hypothetical protein BE221DRAFT_69303 [Ostreococcus tauri]